MLTNYFKTTWRSLKKNKGFFALNFIGLYVSVVASILIGLIILHETSFDKAKVNGIQVYRVVAHSKNPNGEEYSATTQYPLAASLRNLMPDEKLISQSHYQGKDIITVSDKKFEEDNIMFADSVFPRLFPMQVKAGSIQGALSQPGFVILTEKTAHRYFGQTNPIGKRIKIANAVELQVAAVVADPPSNTHLPYTILGSYLSMNPQLIGGIHIDSWTLTATGFVYIGLSDKNKVKHAEQQLAFIADNYINKLSTDGSKTDYKLQPIEDIHTNQLYAARNVSYTINYTYLSLIAAIGLFLILAACINYTNLSTALAIKKSREVGVRKTMGATRMQLIKQFFSETFFLTGAVILTASITIPFLIPKLNAFLGKNIPEQWLTIQSGLLLLGLWITVSLLSGIYPALVLSGFNPIAALKNKISTPKTSAVTLRRGLVVFQFLTAQVLIICAIVVAKQMAFIQTQPLGFNKDKVVDLLIPTNKYPRQRTLADQLAVIPGVSSVSLSIGAPVSSNQIGTNFNLKEKYKTQPLDAQIKTADRNYLKTYGLQMLAGRWFDATDESRVTPEIPDSLRKYCFVINEEAVRRMGFTTPDQVIGKYLTFGLNDITGPIIGVVKNYHVASLREAIAPVLMIGFPGFYYNVGIKFTNNYTHNTLAAVEKVWNSVYPEQLFTTRFLDENVANLYMEEHRTQQLFYIFTLLSISINVLGLIGLLSFMIEAKTKEIGVRKVLGASIRDISFILSKDFVRLILLAFLIAAPIAGFFMHRWLRDFAYRTELSWWVFALAGLLILFVTGLSVGFQTIKAAVANPVKSLRSE